MNSRILITLFCSPLFLTAFLLTGCYYPNAPSPGFLAQQEAVTRQLLTRGVQELQSSETGAVERAGRLFELAREINRRDPRVLDGLGCYYFRKGELGLARFYFQRALEVDPNYDRAYAHLALIARDDGNIEAARELLRQAVAMNPLNYQQRSNLVALGLEFGTRGGFDSLLTERERIKAEQLTPQTTPITKRTVNGSASESPERRR